jgi:hypothetical protein
MICVPGFRVPDALRSWRFAFSGFRVPGGVPNNKQFIIRYIYRLIISIKIAMFCAFSLELATVFGTKTCFVRRNVHISARCYFFLLNKTRELSFSKTVLQKLL